MAIKKTQIMKLFAIKDGYYKDVKQNGNRNETTMPICDGYAT